MGFFSTTAEEQYRPCSWAWSMFSQCAEHVIKSLIIHYPPWDQGVKTLQAIFLESNINKLCGNTNLIILWPSESFVNAKKSSLWHSCLCFPLYIFLSWSFPWTCSSTSAEKLWQQLHSSNLSCLCSDMSLYSFGLEPLSCHTWNKDRTRRWNRLHFLIQ